MHPAYRGAPGGVEKPAPAPRRVATPASSPGDLAAWAGRAGSAFLPGALVRISPGCQPRLAPGCQPPSEAQPTVDRPDGHGAGAESPTPEEVPRRARRHGLVRS